MYYAYHLAFPAIVAIIVIVANGQAEWSFTWIDKSLGNFGTNYILLALPHWIWASVTSYFESSESTTIGGFIGAHLLLIGVGILVATSNSAEATNGWYLYLFGSPFAIMVCAFLGRKLSQWRVS